MESIATKIFRHVVEFVRPDILVARHLTRHGDVLRLGDHEYNLNKNVYIVGFGKAVSGMCKEVQSVVKEHLVAGVISIPCGIQKDLASAGKSFLLPVPDGKMKVFEGAENNQADQASFNAMEEIARICENASESDLLICLVSGGGSALLPAPIPPLTLEEKLYVTNILASKGATIQELNVVRQNLSLVKGGRLALKAHPAQIWNLILSDIIEDPLEMIASGPTVPRLSNAFDAMKVLEKYKVVDAVPANVNKVLKDTKHLTSEQLHPSLHNVVVGNNVLAISAAVAEVEKLKYNAVVMSSKLKGEARELGRVFANLASKLVEGTSGDIDLRDDCVPDMTSLLESHGMSKVDIEHFFDHLPTFNSSFKGLCIISGGETTVTMQEHHGIGGRNQEMVLSFALHLSKRLAKLSDYDVTFLSAGTDGKDGPTPAAGAVYSSTSFGEIDQVVAEGCLFNHDSYTYFADRQMGLVITGLTATNVMDIQLLFISLKSYLS